MTIAFNQIPIDLRTPGTYIEVDNSQAMRGLTIIPTRACIIAQKLAAGSAPVNTLRLVMSDAHADALGGRGSQLARMVRAFRAANKTTELWVVAVSDTGPSVAAVGSITFTGAATATVGLPVYIGGRRVVAAITSGATIAAQASAVAAAVNADPDMRVTAASAAGKVDFTARNKGLCGNDIDIRIGYYDDEMSVTGVNAAVTPMAGGNTNPDITAPLAGIGDEWFTDIIIPWNDSANLTIFANDLVDRFSAMRMIETHGWRALSMSQANLVAHGDTRNCPHISAPGWEKSPTPPDETAAAVAAQSIAVLSNHPGRPVQNLTVAGVLPPRPEHRFTRMQRNVLLWHGISTMVADAGGNTVIERICTEYRETAAGADDDSYLNVETVKTVSYLRYDTRTFFQVKYPRHMLADDGTRFAPGLPVMTPKLGRAEMINRFILWEEAGLVQDAASFRQNLLVERNGQNRDRMDALLPPTVINQLRNFAALLQFRK